MSKKVAQKRKKRKPKNGAVYGLHGADIVWKAVPRKGRGVFTTRKIRKGEIVEVAPAIPMRKKDVPDGEIPDGYVLDWDEDDRNKRYAMVLGYIMLYNHSDTPNMEMEADLRAKTYTATAICDIKAGEELTWDYGVELWFSKAK